MKSAIKEIKHYDSAVQLQTLRTPFYSLIFTKLGATLAPKKYWLIKYIMLICLSLGVHNATSTQLEKVNLEPSNPTTELQKRILIDADYFAIFSGLTSLVFFITVCSEYKRIENESIFSVIDLSQATKEETEVEFDAAQAELEVMEKYINWITSATVGVTVIAIFMSTPITGTIGMSTYLLMQKLLINSSIKNIDEKRKALDFAAALPSIFKLKMDKDARPNHPTDNQ